MKDNFDGTELTTYTVLITTGMSARTLTAPGLEGLQGVGVYYGAAMTEAAKPVIRLADRMVAQLHRGDAEQIAGMAAIQRFNDAQKEVRA